MADQYYLDPITGQYKVKPKANIVSQPTLTMGVGTSNPLTSALGLSQGQTLTMGQQTTDPITGKIITAPNTVYTPPPAVKSQTTTPPASQTYIPPATSKTTSQTTPQPTPQTTQTQQPMGAFGFSMLMDAIGQKTQQNNELVKQRQLAIKQYFGGSLTPEEMNSLSPELQKALQSGDRNNIEMSIRILGDELSGQKTSLPQTLQYLTEGYKTELQNIEDKKKTMESVLKDYSTLSGDTTAFKNYLETTYGGYLKGMGVDVNSLLGTGGGNINVYGIKSSPLTQSFGGVESGVMASDGGTFLSSLGEEGDKQIAQQLLTSNVYADLTVDQALKKWSNNGYGAEVAPGIDPQAFIRDLPQDQLDTVLAGIKQREGVAISESQSTGQYADLLEDKTKTQRDFFNSLSENEKSNVYQIITGKALISDLAAGMGGAAARQRLLAEAQRIDPNFSENVNKRRYQFQQAWFSPTAAPFKTRTSINTAMGHVAQLKKDADAIDNKTIQKYNSIANMLKKETGNDAVTNFNYTLTQVASEIASAYKNGTAPTDQEVEQERAALAYNFSPKQFQGVFDRAAKLLSSKITSMAEEYRGAMGKYPEEPIVQEFALQEMQDAGIDMSPIVDTLKKQGYQLTGSSDNDPLNIR